MSDPNEGMLQMFSQMVGKNFEEMNDSQKKFYAEMEKCSGQTQAKFEEAANNLFGGKSAKGPQFRPEVLDIANTLQALPVLVPIVQYVIQQYMLEVQKAGETIMEKFGVNQPPAQQPTDGDVSSA